MNFNSSKLFHSREILLGMVQLRLLFSIFSNLIDFFSFKDNFVN